MNEFAIRITAQDRFTANIRRLNDRLAKVTRPIENIRNSVKAMTKEAGLDRFGRNLKNVSEKAGKVSSNIRSIVAPLTAIVGVGTVAGVVDLATQFGRWGNSLTRTSSVLGISTTNLQEFQGAAKMAGLSSESMTGALKSLGDTLEDATYGRNPRAIQMMNQLGISMHRTKSGAVDATRAFRDIANALQNPAFKGNVQAEALVARTMGVESMLYLLQKGSKGIDAYIQKARKLGLIMTPAQIEAANRYNENMMRFDMTLTNLRNTIGNDLVPVLGPLLEKLGAWISKNKQLISSKITEFVQKLADALKNTNWEQWKAGMIGIGLVLAGPLLSSVVSLTASLTTLGLVMWANPVLAAVGAISVALGGAYYWANKLGDSIDKLRGVKSAMPKYGALPPLAPIKYNADGTHSVSIPEGFKLQRKDALAIPGLLGLVKKLERSGDNAISPKGAIGRYQIMPGTAIQYGFDPARLTDPDYNKAAASAVLGALQKRYGNDEDAILAAYNGGPGVADRFIASGRNIVVLPSETQAYLRRAHNIDSQAVNGGASPQPQKVHVEVALKNAPAGTRVTAKNDKNASVGVRIAHAMSPS